MPEGRLVEAARGGDERAFLALYQGHRTSIFRYAYRVTGSVAAAEDITQECFLALLEGAGFDASRGSLRTYLFGAARHLILKHLRLSGREAEEPSDSAAPFNLMEDLLAAERAALVERAVAALPPLQREALVLFEYEELSIEAIAEIAGVEPGAVKARLHRARESLRRQLQGVYS